MIKITIIAALFLVLQSFDLISAQEKGKTQEEQFYWFNIYVIANIDANLKRPITQVNKTFRNIYSGSFFEFAESYRNNLGKGKLSVGPFSTKMQAELALQYYEFFRSKKQKARVNLGMSNKGDENYYFYFAKPDFTDENKYLNFLRFPARIASGPGKEFIDIFFEGSTHKLIAIGPFDNLLTAEKSKYISRKYGENGSTRSENDTTVSFVLKDMAEIWKSIKIDITDVQFNEKKDSISCKLNVQFPPNYFDENTVQVITFGYSNNDTTITFSDGITVQGQGFQDNNTVVFYNDSSSVPYFLTIPYPADKNSHFIVKSTLFSDFYMLKCDDILLEFKPE